MTGMQAAPEVSVILPVYNGEAYLHQAMTSILDQDGDFELIVCDDVSVDNSLSVMSSFNDVRIRVLQNSRNLGIFGNLNLCIGHARGSCIQIFSQDDVMLPGYLASQLAMLHRYPSAGLVYATPDMIDSEGIRTEFGKNDTTPEVIDAPLYLWLSAHFGSIAPSISSVMVRKRTFDIVGVFNPEFAVAGDLDFYNRVSEKFDLIRNRERLHLVRGHRQMTSALPGAGRKYLDEELRLQQWYRDRFSAADYARVMRYRAATRGRYHLGWIRRLARQGQLRGAFEALWKLRRIYPLRSVLAGIFGTPGSRVPELPPPGGW